MAATFSKPPSKYEQVIAVLTSKSIPRILNEGGTSSWTLNRANARKARYVVCVWNARHDEVSRPGEHGAAFIVGRVKDVVTSPENPDRWLITFSAYAEVNVSDAWGGWRNPVRYTSFDELGIDTESLKFVDMPEISKNSFNDVKKDIENLKLTMEEAKIGLANNFGVPINSIEITIRY